MKSIERPYTLTDQIKNLQQRGLIIDSSGETRDYFTHIGYYRLSGYWQFLQNDSIESKQLYYQLCIVRYLLHTASPGNDFSYRLMELLVKYQGIDLERMGFLDNWDEEDLWQ